MKSKIEQQKFQSYEEKTEKNQQQVQKLDEETERAIANFRFACRCPQATIEQEFADIEQHAAALRSRIRELIEEARKEGADAIWAMPHD